MEENRWVGITLRGPAEAEEWFGELDCTLEQFFAAPDNAFVRLNRVRWLESESEFEAPNLVRNQDADPPFKHYIYFRKSDVSIIRPLRAALQARSEEAE